MGEREEGKWEVWGLWEVYTDLRREIIAWEKEIKIMEGSGSLRTVGIESGLCCLWERPHLSAFFAYKNSIQSGCFFSDRKPQRESQVESLSSLMFIFFEAPREAASRAPQPITSSTSHLPTQNPRNQRESPSSHHSPCQHHKHLRPCLKSPLRKPLLERSLFRHI